MCWLVKIVHIVYFDDFFYYLTDYDLKKNVIESSYLLDCSERIREKMNSNKHANVVIWKVAPSLAEPSQVKPRRAGFDLQLIVLTLRFYF